MSPRRNHPKRRGPKPEERDIATSHETIEEHAEGIFTVRRVTGSGSTKPYRCPGCDQLIPMGTPHTVAWIDNDLDGRRHWHTVCWERREDRKPRIVKTPRY